MDKKIMVSDLAKEILILKGKIAYKQQNMQNDEELKMFVNEYTKKIDVLLEKCCELDEEEWWKVLCREDGLYRVEIIVYEYV